MHLKKIAKNQIIEQHLYEYKKAPLERFTFLQISSELIFVHHWMVELGSVNKNKPGVTRGPLCNVCWLNDWHDNNKNQRQQQWRWWWLSWWCRRDGDRNGNSTFYIAFGIVIAIPPPLLLHVAFSAVVAIIVGNIFFIIKFAFILHLFLLKCGFLTARLLVKVDWPY